MKLHAHITDTTTGETRVHHFEDEPEDLWLVEFDWGENNMSCDCNRHIFFARAGGQEAEDRECGHVRFAVKILDDSDRVVYEDD